MDSRSSIGAKPLQARIGFGAMDLSEPPLDDERSIALLRRAVDLGVELIDTADRYGRGHNEELIGRAFASSSIPVPIGTKIGFVGKPGDAQPVNNRPAFLRRACEASLRRLRSESIELLCLHRVDPAIPLAESIGLLNELRDEGKVRRIGVSEVGPVTLGRIVEVGAIDVVQLEYSLASRDPGDAVRTAAAELDIELHASSPLAIGLLDGDPEHLAVEEDRLHRRLRMSPRLAKEHRATNVSRLRQLGEIATRAGCSVPQLALAWLLHQGAHVVPLPGTRRIDHLEENLRAGHRELSVDDLTDLDRHFEAGALAGDRKGRLALGLSLP